MDSGCSVAFSSIQSFTYRPTAETFDEFYFQAGGSVYPSKNSYSNLFFLLCFLLDFGKILGYDS